MRIFLRTKLARWPLAAAVAVVLHELAHAAHFLAPTGEAPWEEDMADGIARAWAARDASPLGRQVVRVVRRHERDREREAERAYPMRDDF